MWDGFPENRDCCYFVLALSTLDTCANKSYEALLLLCLGGCILTYRVGLLAVLIIIQFSLPLLISYSKEKHFQFKDNYALLSSGI